MTARYQEPFSLIVRALAYGAPCSSALDTRSIRPRPRRSKVRPGQHGARPGRHTQLDRGRRSSAGWPLRRGWAGARMRSGPDACSRAVSRPRPSHPSPIEDRLPDELQLAGRGASGLPPAAPIVPSVQPPRTGASFEAGQRRRRRLDLAAGLQALLAYNHFAAAVVAFADETVTASLAWPGRSAPGTGRRSPAPVPGQPLPQLTSPRQRPFERCRLSTTF